MGWVYGIQCREFIKVGCTQDMRRRFEEMRLANPFPLKVILKRQTRHPRRLEAFVHRHLTHVAIGREWFMATPAQVREAADSGMADLYKWLNEQQEWEMFSARRVLACFDPYWPILLLAVAYFEFENRKGAPVVYAAT